MTKECYEWLFSDANNTDIKRLFLNGSITPDLISSPNRASSELTPRKCLLSSLDQSTSVEHLTQLKNDYSNLVINLTSSLMNETKTFSPSFYQFFNACNLLFDFLFSVYFSMFVFILLLNLLFFLFNCSQNVYQLP